MENNNSQIAKNWYIKGTEKNRVRVRLEYLELSHQKSVLGDDAFYKWLYDQHISKQKPKPRPVGQYDLFNQPKQTSVPKCQIKLDWRKEDILVWLKKSVAFNIKAMLKLYDRQTSDEQNVDESIHDNEIGFNKLDAPILMPFVKKYLAEGKLDSKEIAIMRYRLKKYAKQLADIANTHHRNLARSL